MAEDANGGRLFAIGDVHGHLDRLDPLLARLAALDPAARLVFMGDYIDRGAQSRQVIERLLEIQRARPDTVFLLGNHEEALLRYGATQDPEDLRSLRGMGFEATLESYGSRSGASGLAFMPEEHRTFLLGLSRWFRMPGHVFFHAPLPYGVDPGKADVHALEGLLANREIDREGWARSGETQVFGHIPFEAPLVAPGLIGIDTGAGHGRVLTALELPEVRFHHA